MPLRTDAHPTSLCDLRPSALITPALQPAHTGNLGAGVYIKEGSKQAGNIGLQPGDRILAIDKTGMLAVTKVAPHFTAPHASLSSHTSCSCGKLSPSHYQPLADICSAAAQQV